MRQSDVDALDEFLRLTTQLESLNLQIFGRERKDRRFGVEGLSISTIDKSTIVFRKGTTQRLRQLRSFTLLDDTTVSAGGVWPVLSHFLGESLQNLDLYVEHLNPDQLHQIAKSWPCLTEFILDGQGGASYTDISRFIESAKPPLIRLELHFSGLPESDTDPASVVFESLLHYGKDIEVLHFSTAYGLSRADLRVLAHPECLPHLRELSIGRFDYERTDMQRVAKAHPCEKMIVAVLQSHKTTLESISLEGEDLLLGDAFVQACVELPQLHSIDRVDFAAETSLRLLECLFHKHDWLGTDLVQTAILRLSMRRVCAACLSVNGDIVRTHRIHECPEAASINFQEAETKQWPEGE